MMIQTKQDALKLIQSRLKPKRMAHSIAVAKAAKLLAQRFGSDPERAELTGLLHDVMKDAPPEEQLQWAKKSAIMIDNAEMENGQLWHAPAGEAYLRISCGLEDNEILHAVRFHTTGRAGMSQLEQILYLADIISEDRDFDGVDAVREAAQSGLKEGVLAGLTATLKKIREDGEIICPRSEEAVCELTGGVN